MTETTDNRQSSMSPVKLNSTLKSNGFKRKPSKNISYVENTPKNDAELKSKLKLDLKTAFNKLSSSVLK